MVGEPWYRSFSTYDRRVKSPHAQQITRARKDGGSGFGSKSYEYPYARLFTVVAAVMGDAR